MILSWKMRFGSMRNLVLRINSLIPEIVCVCVCCRLNTFDLLLCDLLLNPSLRCDDHSFIFQPFFFFWMCVINQLKNCAYRTFEPLHFAANEGFNADIRRCKASEAESAC
jgi:hypothetical protein